MLDVNGLESLIKEIETLYQRETDTLKVRLLAKLATIEVSGWTEECIDSILNSYIDLVNPDCKKDLQERIKKINGFHYSNDFRNICIQILGAIMFEKIESLLRLESQQLESSLNGLRENRNRCAHTYVNEHTTIEAPNKTFEHLKYIKKSLEKFESELVKIKYPT
jgi:hypothetical protein